MKFIDRQQELSRLNRLTRSEEASLAVVWGRRRVGKTRLLLEWVHAHQGIYYTADESAAAVQRKYFSLAIQQILPDFAAVEYADWNSLLIRLAKEIRYINWRGPLVIDELPYLIAASPEFASLMQRFVDHEAKQANLILALCGSSQRMMQGAVLAASAPLFGRANEIIKLRPIPAGYIGEALAIKEAREAIEMYAVWGGVPRYWELVKNVGGSLSHAIDHLVLDPLGVLSDEPNRLLLEESAISLRPILDAIGLGAHRLSDIATRLGQPATSLTRPIQSLLELDLIEREIPFGADEQNSKRTLYKIKDPFIRFWFEIVASQRSFLTQATALQRRMHLKRTLHPLFSLTWEELCRAAIPSLSRNWGKEMFGKASRYWYKKDHEWDVLAESMEGKVLLVGEVKWLEKVPSAAWVYRTIEELKRKGLPAGMNHSSYSPIYYALFIPEKPKHLMLPTHVKVIDAEEVLTGLRE